MIDLLPLPPATDGDSIGALSGEALAGLWVSRAYRRQGVARRLADANGRARRRRGRGRRAPGERVA